MKFIERTWELIPTYVTHLPLPFKSEINELYFVSFLLRAPLKPEGVFLQMVSSWIDISASETRTRSGVSDI